jgi:hypothetical protein
MRSGTSAGGKLPSPDFSWLRSASALRQEAILFGLRGTSVFSPNAPVPGSHAEFKLLFSASFQSSYQQSKASFIARVSFTATRLYRLRVWKKA